MIPIRLSLEGVYSYQARQEIDFSRLINAGLFGIFGAVGSGKSTILESISFALYGEADRMKSDNRAYNMMNLKSDRMYIEFDFYNFEDKIYRIVREFKRNSKQFDKVNNAGATLYEWKDENWLPLDHTNVAEVIGLSAENFKRTIIIPQGKFKEFIELGGSDRTKMMKEIFNLHRFDLGDNIKRLFTANEVELNILLGKLSGYEAISEEIISEKAKQFVDQEVIFKTQEVEHKKLVDSFDILKNLRQNILSLNEKKAKLEIEKSNKIEIDKADIKLKNYIQIQQQFEAILKLEKQLSEKLNVQTAHLKSQKETFSQLEKKIEDNKQQMLLVKPFIDQLESKKEGISDLKLIKEILSHQFQIENNKERTEKGKKLVSNLNQTQKEQDEKIKKSEAEIIKTTSKLIDSSILTAAEIWFHQQKTIVENQKKNEENLIDSIQKINEVEKEFTDLNFSKSAWKIELEAKSEKIKNKLDELIQQKTKLEVKQQIAQFAHELHDGVDCPLCGSTEHPHIVESEDVSADLVKIETQILAEKEAEKVLIQISNQLTQLQNKHDNWKEKFNSFETDKKTLFLQFEAHTNNFQWQSIFSKDEADFKQKKGDNELIIQQKRELEEQLKSLRIHFAETGNSLRKAEETFQTIENENLRFTTLMADNISNIKHLILDEYQNFSIDSMTDLIDKEEQLISTNQKKFQELESTKNNLSVEFATNKATIESIEKSVAELKSEQQVNSSELENRLSQLNLNSRSEVELVLNQQIDVDSERKRIQDFQIEYESLVKLISELEKTTAGKSFSEEDYALEQNKLMISQQSLKELGEILANLKFELERIQKEYTEKKVLLDQKNALENRKTNIQTMQSLFKGNGFVEYVSSIYLKNLCQMANKRFHRMTKNQLSLQVSESNDFEIIDYLNNGRSRSVKTLSGGQSFQVSLSLALALAENVQSLSKSNKNFFFIDEGFGTQDAESVNIVFETLSNLRQENRIVGIISHVEELQERIPISLTIHNDAERGSLIAVD
ncbi:MAG: SMC family ATPase [Crocinitomicaceae bacterium]|nr:SMC family ATPase [Crocinitomicaceae bacterium]